jgi:hypothetical protein
MPALSKRAWASADAHWLDVQLLQFAPREGGAEDVSLPYTFDVDTDTTVDPGLGDVRLNDGNMSLVSELAISTTDANAVDQATLLADLAVGQRIAVIQTTQRFWVGFISASPVDNATWFQIDVVTVDGGTAIQNNADVAFTVQLSDSLPQGSDTLQIQMALEWPWIPYRIFNAGETAPKEQGVFAESDIRRIVIF